MSIFRHEFLHNHNTNSTTYAFNDFIANICYETLNIFDFVKKTSHNVINF